MVDSSKIAAIIVQHLMEINEGYCSITLEMISAEKDENFKHILIGLLYVHQDNVLMKEELVEKDKARKEHEQRLLEQREQLFTKSINLEESRNKLEALNEELQQFVYIASHDLKTPLLGIHTLASFIEADLKEENYKRIKEHINALKNRAARMHNLLNGILEYSKIGIDSLVIEEIDLNKTLQELIDLSDRPKNFIVTVKTKLPTIQGVRIHMEQLFGNLISNAIKFNNKQNGTIEIDYCTDAEGHLFSFRDNGVGIEKKYFEKIFIAFQALNVEEDFKSTGIGLAIVKKIIDQLKGSIEVSSVVNKGTQFLVRMPL